jgi:nucleotide-binding universal stress UspA family protein
MRKILVALDGSLFSEAIIPYVKDLIEYSKHEVVLIRVIEPVTLPFTSGYIGHEKYEREIMKKAEEEAKDYLPKIQGIFEQQGVKTGTALLKGHPANSILAYAEENNINLIAITTHGYTGITKWAYGSVAANIIEGSKIPILLFRPQLPSVDE